MGKKGIAIAGVGLVANFILFLIKLYVGVSSGLLAIYCDAINNLGDTLSCVIAIVGFYLASRLDEVRGGRAQALASFLIGIIVALTSVYFAYQGLDRLMYPLPVAYSVKYAILIGVTIVVKLFMGVFYALMNRREKSTVIKTLVLDSFMDTGVTVATLMTLVLVNRINFALDGIMSIIIGCYICVVAVKEVVEQSKRIING